MWTMVRIGFMASEEMSFENVDDTDDDTDGRRTDDGCLARLYAHLGAFGLGDLKKMTKLSNMTLHILPNILY